MECSGDSDYKPGQPVVTRLLSATPSHVTPFRPSPPFTVPSPHLAAVIVGIPIPSPMKTMMFFASLWLRSLSRAASSSPSASRYQNTLSETDAHFSVRGAQGNGTRLSYNDQPFISVASAWFQMLKSGSLKLHPLKQNKRNATST